MAKRTKKAPKQATKRTRRKTPAKAPKAKEQKRERKELPLPVLPDKLRHTTIQEIRDTVGVHWHVETNPPKEGMGCKVECGSETFLLVIKSVRPLVNGGHSVMAFLRKGAGDGARFLACRGKAGKIAF